MTLWFLTMAIIFDKNFSDIGKSPFILSVGKKLIEWLYKKAIVFSLVAFPSSSLLEDLIFFYFFNYFVNFRIIRRYIFAFNACAKRI